MLKDYSQDVQDAVLSFAVDGSANADSSDFVFLCLDNGIDIDDVIVILKHIQFRMESFLASAK